MRELLAGLWGAAIMFFAAAGPVIVFKSRGLRGLKGVTFDSVLYWLSLDLTSLGWSALAGAALGVWIASRKPPFWEAAFIGAGCGVLTTGLLAFAGGISLGESIGNALAMMLLGTYILGIPSAFVWFIGTMLLCFILGFDKWTRKSPRKRFTSTH
jgi:hypothetical protein